MSTPILRRSRVVLLALFALAFGLQLWNLSGQSLWRDEVDAIRFSLQPLQGLADLFLTPGQNGPLYYLLLRPWLGLAGTSEFALRFFSLFWAVLCLPLLYHLARRLGARRTAWVAVLLAAVSPYLIWYAQEGKMYSLVLAIVLAATLVWIDALSHSGPLWRWALYIVLVSASLAVHLLAVLMLPVHALFLVAWRRRWRPALLTLAALALLYLPLALWQVPLLLEPADTGYAFVPLHEMLAGLASQYSRGVVASPSVALLPFLLLTLAAFYPSGEAFAPPRSARRHTPLMLASWFLLPPVLLFLVSLSRPLYTERYLIFILPAWLMLLTLGTRRLGQLNRPLAIVLLLAVLALDARGLWLQASTSIKADLRAATRYVWHRHEPNDLILFQIPYSRFGFDYYVRRQPLPSPPARTGSHRLWLPLVQRVPGLSRREPGFRGGYPWAEGPYTNYGQPPREVAGQMERLVARHRVVWLFETESALWDARGLTRAWLDAHAQLSYEVHFTRVSVYRFVLQP